MTNSAYLTKNGFGKYAEGFCSVNELVIEVTNVEASEVSDIVYVYVDASTDQVLYVGESKQMAKARSNAQKKDISKHIASNFAPTSGKNGNVATAIRWYNTLKGREFNIFVKSPDKVELYGVKATSRYSLEAALIAKFNPILNEKT